MTAARLLSAPADGHGLTDKLTDPLYSALANGKPTGELVAVVVLKPVGLGQRETAKGRHQHVQFEVTHLEPVGDANQANELRYLLQGLYEQRTSTGEQRTLPLGLGGDEEKRLALMERMEEWAGENDLTGGALEVRWRENFGAGTDDDWSFGDQGVPGDYRQASVAQLMSFCFTQGVLSTDAPLPHEDRGADADVEDDDDAGDEPVDGASDVDEAAPVAGVACQVCNKPSAELFDGLCPKCAKTAGIPAAVAFSNATTA